MKQTIIRIISSLVIRFIGSLLISYGYNTVAYEFNLPTFSCLVFFTIDIGLRFLLTTFSPIED